MIKVTFGPSASSYVRSYKVLLGTGGDGSVWPANARMIAEPGRSGDGVTIPVDTPGSVHCVAILPVSTVGVIGNWGGGTFPTGAPTYWSYVTPGAYSGTPAVTLGTCHAWNVANTIQPLGGVAQYSALFCSLAWTTSNLAGKIKHFEVRRNGRMVGEPIPNTITGLNIMSKPLVASNPSITAPNVLGGVGIGDVLTVVAVCFDGQEVASSSWTVALTTGFQYDLFLGGSANDLMKVSNYNANIVEPLTGGAPPVGSFAYFSGAWAYLRLSAYHATFGTSDMYVRWNHGKNNSNPVVVLGPGASDYFWYTVFDANNIDIHRATTGAAVTCDVVGYF